MEPIYDSPIEWVARHAKSYVDSDGLDGGRLFDNDVLLITTRGRRSGRLRRTPLMYGRDDERYIVVASYRGRPANPCWYLNLATNPDVTLQVGPDVFPAKAIGVSERERSALWELMTSLFPTFGDYQKQSLRRFPIVALRPMWA
jgi:deazaflavin-dependent oxidoreductase (nitroreductase family)